MAGRLVVDTRRGLELGHAPAGAVDDLGIAIAAVTKAIRSIDRALGENESEKRQERMKAAGITAWSQLPKWMELLCWCDFCSLYQDQYV
jgi:hypothetical protein